MYSFHVSDEDLDAYYERVQQAYFNVYKRCGLNAYMIEASGGAFSDKYSHEFSVETPAGEDVIIICEKCGSAQNLEIAQGKVIDPDGSEEAELPLEEVTIEHGSSVEENAKAHGIENWKILKTVVYEVDGAGLLGVVIRGDLSVNEVKLENYIKKPLRPASLDMLQKVGLVQGFISPVNLPAGIEISFIADHSVKNVKNFVTGANVAGKDFKNVNVGRDFLIADFTDLVEVKSGFKCKSCDLPLKEIKAVEVGNIFKLGTRYSEAFGVNFTDSDGKSKPAIMGCYGIGTTRLIGSIVEALSDEKGIVWPMSVAPYQIHLVSLGKDEELLTKAGQLYEDLKKAGFTVLFDDRHDSAGIKLNDADLIGIPLRLVISNRTIEAGGVEWKVRSEEEARQVEFAKLKNEIESFIAG